MSYINKLANLKVGQSIPRWQLTDCKDSHQYRSKDYGVHQDRTRAVYMYALYKFPESKFKLSKEFVTREEDNTIESEKIKSEEIKFEDANFRVDSTGWREQKRTVDGKATRIKVSPKTAEYPEGEITEIVE